MTQADLTFAIKKFSAWSPQLSNQSDWLQFFESNTLPEDEQKPDLSFIPAMQRRRLSPLARAALYVIHQVAGDLTSYPSVYCSQYGESQRTYSILEDVAKGDDVSPMAFSLSVHNAISGQAGIYFNNTEPTIAIGTDEQGYLNALTDALGLLHEGKEHVVVVFYEEQQPEFYQTQQHAPNFACATALLISKANSGEQNVSLSYNTDGANTKEQSEPQLLSLIRFLTTTQTKLKIGSWQLNKNV